MAQTTSPISSSVLRPPIVVVLGHVDHGKTTLLDTIRKTGLAAKEHGGITQHIGAYQIEFPKKITFIDTPGHEAFAKMRARGAQVADIAILVVAANDGVMPQTLESLHHIKEAKIPFIVAMNKIDLADVQVEKIKKQLIKAGVNLEEYGGETPLIPISAKNNIGIDKLLEMVAFLAEFAQVGKNALSSFKAVIIESIVSKNRGIVATIIVRSGTVVVGDEIHCEDQTFRVRALIDWQGRNISQATGGQPVELLGWKQLPSIGSIVSQTKEEKNIPPLIPSLQITPVISSQEKEEIERIKLIIKADTAGTLEAILAGLTQNDVQIIASGVGNITESEVLLAKTAKAIIVGFHISPHDQTIKLAQSEKVLIKTYNIIYELFDEIKDVVEAIRKGNLVTILGEAKIAALFPMKNEIIAGVKIISGRIARGDQVKIMRGEKEIGRTRIKSLRFGKEDVTKAEQGKEAGVLLSQNVELLTGDSIISIG